MRIFLCHFLYNFVKENINRARCPQRKTPSSLSRTFPTRREQGRVTAHDAFMHPALKRRLRDRRLSAGTPSAAPVKKGRPCRVAEGASVKVRKGIFIPGVRVGKLRGSPEAGRKVPKRREVPGRRGNAGAGFDLPAKGRTRRGAAGERSESAGIGPDTRRRSCKDAPRTPRSAAEKSGVRPARCRNAGKRRECRGGPEDLPAARCSDRAFSLPRTGRRRSSRPPR